MRTITAAERSRLIRYAAKLPKGSPKRLAIVKRLARSEIGLTVEYERQWYDAKPNERPESGILLRGNYSSVREAIDAVLDHPDHNVERKEWHYSHGTNIVGEEEVVIDSSIGEAYVTYYEVVLTFRGKPFPKSVQDKALIYLRSGKSDFGPMMVGNTLRIEGKRGLIEIIPGNKKAWFRWTYKRDGKDVSSFSRGWSTQDSHDLEMKKPGASSTHPEAWGIIQKLKEDTLLDKKTLDTLEKWFISHSDFRGFKTARHHV